MAIIKSMHLKGFKSFAKPINLEFGTGFNCIIGPNGSGKSNIMDAMCFVLGKLSAKSMRAEKASNLIFNGGKNSSQLKEAEVSIIFSNDDNEFPVESNEIKLTRVIKSTGNSVYKINDEILTRQQIIEVLSAAKIDPDGHNIILQGDIVRFMGMKPEQRRELIEEVAGISVFENKKNKAMTSLNRVEGQLNDVTIILHERESYLKELRKDKDQAEKYKNLEKNIKSNKATYFHLQLKERNVKKEEIESKIKKQENNKKKLEEREKEIWENIKKKKGELENINKDIEEKGEKEAIELQNEIESLKTELARNQERNETCKSEINKIIERKKQLETSEQDINKTIKGLKESKGELDEKIKILKRGEEEKSKQINNLKTKLGIISNSEFEKIEEELDEKLKEYEKLQEINQDLLQKKFKIDAEISSIEDKISTGEQLEKTSNAPAIRKRLEVITKEISKSATEDTVLYEKLKSAKENYSQLNEELFKLQTQRNSAKASVEGDRAIKKILDQKHPGVYGTVSQLGSVEKKFATALDVAAGARIKSLVVLDDKIAASCIKTLKESRSGIATFLPMNKIRARSTTKIKGNGIYGSAIDLIEYNPKFKTIFSYVFANTLVVEDIATARRVGIGKVRMVTLEGDIVEMSGAMIGGYRTKRQGVGFNEKTIDNKLEKITGEIDQSKRILNLLEKRKIENEEKINKIRNEKSEIEGELIKLERSTSGLSVTELKKKRKELKESPIYKEFSDIGNQMEILNKTLQKTKAEKVKLKGNSNSNEKGNRLDNLENKRLKIREEIVEKNTEIKNITIQLTNIYGPEKEKILQLIKNSEKETEDFKEEHKTLGQLIKDQKTLLNKKDSEKSKFQKAYKDLFSARNKLSETIQKLEGTTLIETTKIKSINEKINDLSIKKAKVMAEREAIDQEMEEFKGITLRRGITKEDLKVEIKNFENMISKMGNVNMRALEVYENIKKEYESLVEKTDKLKMEKEDVLDMIAEIEKNKKDIFLKTFKTINNNFSRIFRSLSNKGEAAMEVENKESPLDGGIDIRVRITGNKFLDIKSMSGGEKTMAALAFIFAIQEYQPAAFYLLDEVDAALDKKNSELLSELVSKYSAGAQYIMISHNDNVITEADYVYGVSMHQTGISKIISLKL